MTINMYLVGEKKVSMEPSRDTVLNQRRLRHSTLIQHCAPTGVQGTNLIPLWSANDRDSVHWIQDIIRSCAFLISRHFREIIKSRIVVF